MCPFSSSVLNMAKNAALANTEARTNVRINALAPGPVRTDFLPSQLHQYGGNTDIFCDALGKFDVARVKIILMKLCLRNCECGSIPRFRSVSI